MPTGPHPTRLRRPPSPAKREKAFCAGGRRRNVTSLRHCSRVDYRRRVADSRSFARRKWRSPPFFLLPCAPLMWFPKAAAVAAQNLDLQLQPDQSDVQNDEHRLGGAQGFAEPLGRSGVSSRSWPRWSQWSGAITAWRCRCPKADEPVIDLDYWNLPYYALRTTLRMFAALVASLVFTFTYATLAAKSRRAEMVLIPVLDILQSVPILGFLSFTVTFFLGLFPGQRARRGMRGGFRHLHEPGLEHGLFVLPVAAHRAARPR